MTTAIAAPPRRAGPTRDYISYSALSTFATCPLRYYFRYVSGLPEEVVSASLVFGSSLHAAVELHFRELLAGNGPPGLDTLLGAFWESWRTFEGKTIQFGKSEDINSIGHLADRMLKAFLESDFSSPQGRIIGVEEELRGRLIPGLPDLLGRVDLLLETDEALHIVDFKSSRSSWSDDHVNEAAGQLLLYSELAGPLTDGKPVRTSFAVLTKTKTPELTVHPVEVDPRQVSRTKKMVERIWRAIEGGQFYPNATAMNCAGCPFREPCRQWSG